MPTNDSTQVGNAPPTLLTLFLICLKIGLTSFGGGVTGWAYQELVVRRKLVNDEDFGSSLAVAQMLPGINVVNLLISIGYQLYGLAGAVTSIFGVLLGPFFCVIVLCELFTYFSDVSILAPAAEGMAAAAVGLMMQLNIRGTQRALKFPPAVGVIAATALAIGFLHLSLVPVVLVLAPISVALAWRRK